MKHIVIVCDGAADWSIEALGNRTIFEATETPNLDWIASNGKMGTLKTVPEGMEPGSECANMTIMGYRPERDLTGRGPLEALSAGVKLNDNDIAFRCNLITIKDGLINDYSAGHITTEESKILINYLQNILKEDGVDLFPGVQYRHILRIDGNKFSTKISTTPPHDQLDKPYKSFLPKPKDKSDKKAVNTADLMNKLIEKSHKPLIEHEINKNREKNGNKMATHIWPWSGGKKPNIKPFKIKYGLNGSVISAVDLLFGLGIAAGLDPIHVEGATGLPNTNYKGKVNAALNELKTKDFVYLHIEAIDEMAHAGDFNRKMAALKDFDQYVVKPIIEAEKEFNNQIIIAVLPDHATPCKIRTHANEPIPFAIFNPLKDKETKMLRKYSEKSGRDGEYGLIKNGEEFMNLFLKI
ncbi:MAG TPA: cofactor-independent phosphoglycerate mutase [Candidatus Lokiarchaeia archaeon]